MIYLNLSIGYQNVEGLHSDLFGCKLESEINLNCDIEILSETWTSCKNCPNVKTPGYEIVDFINPEKIGKKGRSSGGLSILCKTIFKSKVKVIRSSDKYIWFEIDKSIFENLDHNVKICAIYSQPILSKYYTGILFGTILSQMFLILGPNSLLCA